ncbi:MAG TPA: hypothetical protein VKA15_24920 [Isosphaeraceae bacterium]|nr:hypothetical protein [Isosphaeraceae bacterium]
MRSLDYTRFAAHCLAIYESPRYSPETLVKMSQLLVPLGPFGIRSTDELTTDLFRAYVAGRTGIVSNNTIRGELT